MRNTLLITQARLGSTRLPGKVLLKINGTEMLRLHIDRLLGCKLVSHLIVATTNLEEDDLLVNLCNTWGINSSRGSVDDVLDRFYQAARHIKPEWVVRVTSDCPLLDPKLVDAVIALAQVNDVDYCSNVLIEDFPDGQDVEVFKFSALERTWKEAVLKSDREHVTTYIRANSRLPKNRQFNTLNFPCSGNFSRVRMTVDEPRDLDLIKRLVEDLGPNCSWIEYADYITTHELDAINMGIERNEGLKKSLNNDENE